MIPGCSSLADVRASRWKRSTNSLSNASEKGSTLMATSRSSCFSRALNTIAMPPRPSSSRISYSSFSWSRTISSSVISGAGSRPPAMGVAARSRPQDRQNLLASSFWVPQRGQYINAPRSRGNLEIRRSGCQLDTGDGHSKVRAQRGVELRSASRARRGGGERLRDAEPRREPEVVAQRDVARQLDTGGAQAREPGRGARRPRVADVGERVDPQLVDADREMPQRPAHQCQRDAILDAAHGRALPGELARAIPADRKGARRGERRREVDAHTLRRDAAHPEQRPERPIRAPGRHPAREHRVSEAARTRRWQVPGEPGAQLVRPARGARLIAPPVRQ